jgi:Tfp pilus assembly protein PilF
MMPRTALLLIVLFLSAPALAQEDTKANVPFREDAGLITTEYYLATGKYTQALDVLNGVLSRHPQNADAYTYRALAYQNLGDLKKARDDYTQALAINPKHLGALKYTGSLFVMKGKLSQALEVLYAIRQICGPSACEEQDELEYEINNLKKKK